MPDREKVIKGLACLMTNTVPCDGCPYNKGEYSYCLRNIANDALALLKGHIMTPEEVEAVGQQELVWVELRRTDALYAAIREGNDFTTVGNDDYFMLGEVTDCDDYLRWYRFWSARPTNEQREAVKWDEG